MERYLLYIDVLGFSSLVDADSPKIQELYEIIDDLNVHKHEVFHTIVFSDTILVYNVVAPQTKYDHEYVVMFSCEFFQDLLYRTIGRDLYFRGMLTKGEFEHRRLENIDSFYGKALVEAYRKEKDIGCTGLFMDERCREHNKVFKLARHDKDLSFVFLNQSLEQLRYSTGGLLPFPSPKPIEGTDLHWWIAKDVRMLRDMHWQMENHQSPRVRAKHQAAWHYYRSRYPWLLTALEQGDFKLEAICPTLDWTEAEKRVLDW